jgi:competence protein ComEC
VSFQLSALATLGIILFGSKKQSDGQSLPHAPLGIPKSSPLTFFWSLIEEDLRISLAAQVFTIPIFLFHFHRISLISPVANVAIAPTIAPLTILGWITAGLGVLWLPLVVIISWVDWLLLQYLLIIVTVSSHIPYASIQW